MHLAALHFSFYISNEIEPYFVLFQTERPLAVFLFGKLKELFYPLWKGLLSLKSWRKKTLLANVKV